VAAPAVAKPVVQNGATKFKYDISRMAKNQKQDENQMRDIFLYNAAGVNLGGLADLGGVLRFDAYEYTADISQDLYDNLLVQEEVDWKKVADAKAKVDWTEAQAEGNMWRAFDSPALANLLPAGLQGMSDLMFPYKFREHFGHKRDVSGRNLDLLVMKSEREAGSVKDYQLDEAYDNYSAFNDMHDFFTMRTMGALGVFPMGAQVGGLNLWAMPSWSAVQTWLDVADAQLERAEDAYAANPNWETYSDMLMKEYKVEQREGEELVRMGQMTGNGLLVNLGFHDWSEANSRIADIKHEIAADNYFDAYGRYPVDYYDY